MCVCVPATFHKCCSVYVISKVQIAFHTTQLHTTLNVFTSRIIPLHRTKRFYTSSPFTSHHSTPVTPPTAQHSTSHYYIPHVPRHISQTAFIVATDLTSDHHILHLTSHYTAVYLPPPFHTTTSHQSTPATIPHHTHIQHHNTVVHTTPYSRSHYTITS